MTVALPTPSITAVVPATDRRRSLSRCLAALRASDSPPERVIVVDRPPGAGPAEARNRGAGEAETELVAFVDADVEVHPEALGRLRRAFIRDPELVAVFGSYDDHPADPGTVSQFRNLLHHHVHAGAAGEAESFWAGLGAVRRDRFLAAGGFDARRYPEPAVEDIELGARLSAAGARIVLDPSIRGTHLKRWSAASMLRTDFARRAIPWARLALESRHATSALNLSWRHRLSAAASVALAAGIAVRRPRAAVPAAGALIALNARFYALLGRRGGVRLLGAGVCLHVIHHLVAVAALPVAVAMHLGAGRR